MKRKDVQTLASELKSELAPLPEEFFGSFNFTTIGRNYTHPIVLGAVSALVRQMPQVQFVGIDVRFNAGAGIKFQPDVVGFDQELNPCLAIDYESPNSSDARVPEKDWTPFSKWREHSYDSMTYVVLTTLPDRASRNWQLRRTSFGSRNAPFKGQREKVRTNPFRFWYGYYASRRSEFDLADIWMVNISDKNVGLVEWEEI